MPVLIPSVNGTVCCEPDSAARILDALQAGAATAEVAYTVTVPAFTTEQAQALGHHRGGRPARRVRADHQPRRAASRGSPTSTASPTSCGARHPAGRDVLDQRLRRASARSRRASSTRRVIYNGELRERRRRRRVAVRHHRCSTPRSSPASTSASTRATRSRSRPVPRGPRGHDLLPAPGPADQEHHALRRADLADLHRRRASPSPVLDARRGRVHQPRRRRARRATAPAWTTTPHPHLPRRHHRRGLPSSPSTAPAKASTADDGQHPQTNRDG